MSNKTLTSRIIFAILGMVLLSIGLNIVLGIDWGMSTFDTATLVAQELFKVNNFGNAALICHAIYCILLVIFMKKLQSSFLQIGTSIISIFILTRVINVFAFLENAHFNTFAANLVLFVVFVMIINIGIYFMSMSHLITAPYDRFCLQVSESMNIELGRSRLINDVILFVISLLFVLIFKLPVTIALGTLYIVFLSGPMVTIAGKIFKVKQEFHN